MRRLFVTTGAVVAVAVLLSLSHSKSASLDRLATRIEKAEVIPDETRAELRHLIDTVHYEGRPGRNEAAISRIEQALRTKPAVR